MDAFFILLDFFKLYEGDGPPVLSSLMRVLRARTPSIEFKKRALKEDRIHVAGKKLRHPLAKLN